MVDEPEIRIDGPAGAPVIVLAHGAGAGMESPFLEAVTDGLARRDVRVARFEFPYMRSRHRSGSCRLPDRMPVLEETWRQVVETLGGGARLTIGGKSMGGRVASRIADEVGARGLVCLGYPFYPSGRPDRLRTAHLARLATPSLILQGTRDRLDSSDEVDSYTLSAAIDVRWIPDGDHSFRPRVRSGETLDGNLELACDSIAEFMHRLVRPGSP